MSSAVAGLVRWGEVSELHANGDWRRRVKAPEALPDFPVVTGHGGYPDGS